MSPLVDVPARCGFLGRRSEAKAMAHLRQTEETNGKAILNLVEIPRFCAYGARASNTC